MSTGVRRILEYRPGSGTVRNRSVRVAAAAVVAVGALVGLKKLERDRHGARAPTHPNPDDALQRPDQDAKWGANVHTLDEIASRGEKIYARLKGTLELKFLHQCVFINVDTGEYVLGDTFSEARKNFVARFGDAPSWDIRVGEHPYVFDRTRVLQ